MARSFMRMAALALMLALAPACATAQTQPAEAPAAQQQLFASGIVAELRHWRPRFRTGDPLPSSN